MYLKKAGPKSRNAQGESGEDSNRAPASMRHVAPPVNKHRRSPFVSACFLALIVFAVCYLAGHVAAAIIGWRWLVYVGVGVGIWLIACAFVCLFCRAARYD